MQREDLTGILLSGNKARKLEFLMADAISQGADCVITMGGLQSNHCRTTAAAAKYLKLDCYLICFVEVVPAFNFLLASEYHLSIFEIKQHGLCY